MKIKPASSADAAVIHHIMMKAFMEFKHATPPSSALEETVQSVSDALEQGEKALIAYEEDDPVAMVRFQLKDHRLYFYRLSVLPEKQGKGIAKKMLKSLEDYARSADIPTICCKVRKSVPKNIQLYLSLGYHVYDEEIVQKSDGIHFKVVSMKKEL